VRGALGRRRPGLPAASRLVIIDGTDHLDTFTHDPRAYLRVLLAFIDQQVTAAGHRP